MIPVSDVLAAGGRRGPETSATRQSSFALNNLTNMAIVGKARHDEGRRQFRNPNHSGRSAGFDKLVDLDQAVGISVSELCPLCEMSWCVRSACSLRSPYWAARPVPPPYH